MKIGERIREQRKAKGLTQAQLAARMNTQKQVISRYERSERVPKVDQFIKLCKALEADETWMLTGKGNAQCTE